MGNSGACCKDCRKQTRHKYDLLQILCCDCLVKLGDITRYNTGRRTHGE